MREVLSTACPLDCPDSCSLAVTVEDGRIVGVDANPDTDRHREANPFTQGFICKKVKHHAKRVYSADRILTPLIRTGKKGSGDFREATWDEALDLIAGRVRDSIVEHGADSVLAYLYNSSAGALAAGALTPLLFERLGCPEVTHTICAATTSAAWRQVYGSMLSADPLDLEHSKLIVVWGANPTVSNTHLIPLITKAVKGNGAKLVVVDPRRTGVAGRADLHLPIRPGTDVVLAYALARWLDDNGHMDADFVAANTEGAAAFLAAAQEWTLERAAVECGVDVVDIVKFATMVAEGSPAMLRIGWGLERNRNGGSGCVGVLSAWALTGHFGRLGSGILASTSRAAPVDMNRLWPEGVARPRRRQVSMNDVGLALRGVDPGRTSSDSVGTGRPLTRVLFVQGANPVVTAMDQGTFVSGLERDDLFTAVHDQVLTDTALYADVVLPATTHFEAADLATSYGSYSLQRIRPVIGRVGQSRTNNEVASALARSLGLAPDEFDPNPDRLEARVRSDDSATSQSALRPRGTTIQFLDTRPAGNGRARLHDPDGELPLPTYRSTASSDRLTLLTPASSRTINSIFAEFDPPDAVVSIHLEDANQRNIVDGDRVRAFNELGEVQLTARIDGSVRPGVVSIPKGFWRRSFPTGRTPNALIPRGINDLAQGACFNDARIDLEPIRPS